MWHPLCLLLPALSKGHRYPPFQVHLLSVQDEQAGRWLSKLQHFNVARCMFLLYKRQHILAIKFCFSWIKCPFVSLWTITIGSHGALYQLMHFSENTRGLPFKLEVTLLVTAILSLTAHLPFHTPF